jgi:hypothetical protein
MFGCETVLCDIILSVLLADVTRAPHAVEKRASSSREESRGSCANRQLPRQHCDKSYQGTGNHEIRVVIPDPDSETLWIRIRTGIGNPDPGARKLRNFSGKNALFSYF